MNTETKSSPPPVETKAAPKRGARGPKKAANNGHTLEIDIDIEEDTQKKAIQEKEQVDIARKKNPYLFKVYDERCSLKFKSPQFLK